MRLFLLLKCAPIAVLCFNTSCFTGGLWHDFKMSRGPTAIEKGAFDDKGTLHLLTQFGNGKKYILSGTIPENDELLSLKFSENSSLPETEIPVIITDETGADQNDQRHSIVITTYTESTYGNIRIRDVMVEEPENDRDPPLLSFPLISPINWGHPRTWFTIGVTPVTACFDAATFPFQAIYAIFFFKM